MAQYKVPQDVEADDKLIGPFSFRQFVYLLITGGLIAIGVGLFQLFPLLILIPLPFVLLFGALALPLKKDQPMETYLAAVASYYLKPRNRVWMPGQKESTIEITAPKKVEDDRTRGITGEEATHRLSFLADIVDTGGYAIKGIGGANHVNTELVEEATQAHDMFDDSTFDHLNQTIVRDENMRHVETVRELQNEIVRQVNTVADNTNTDTAQLNNFEKEPEKEVKNETKPANPSIIDLANNPDYSVATIAKEANRIKEREEGEIFISLH